MVVDIKHIVKSPPRWRCGKRWVISHQSSQSMTQQVGLRIKNSLVRVNNASNRIHGSISSNILKPEKNPLRSERGLES